MLIGTQTHNVINDSNPIEGFQMLADAGFSACDFSLNYYLKNTDLYKGQLNSFFDKSIEELELFFTPHVKAAKETGIDIYQMHMPYPNYVPGQSDELNNYLRDVVAVKSMEICRFLKCKYIVIHGFKLASALGSEEAEWAKTSEFLEFLAPLAKEYGITMCIENIYTSAGGHIIEGPCCDANKAVARIDAMNDKFGAQVLGFCYDVGHANLVGLEHERFITTLGDRLKVLHIHDNDGVADLHQIPYTFTKTRENNPSTDWNGFLNGLKAIGYNGSLNFETAPVLSAFPEELKMDALRMIARIGEYFNHCL